MVREESLSDSGVMPLHRKIFNANFWNDKSGPLGGPFTYSPENYTSWPLPFGGENNYYLGYSVEKACKGMEPIPFEDRPQQAFVLAKELHYFYHDDYILNGADKNIRAQFYTRFKREHNVTFIAQMQRHDVPTNIPEPSGVDRIPWMPRRDFQRLLANSRVLLGVGHPRISPTPYEALCLGVPFINPIHWWEHHRPEDDNHWGTQHDALMLQRLGEPYVYHVHKGNVTAMERALKKAMSTPIDRSVVFKNGQ
jgi:hypothetical protein